MNKKSIAAASSVFSYFQKLLSKGILKHFIGAFSEAFFTFYSITESNEKEMNSATIGVTNYLFNTAINGLLQML